MDKIKYDFDQAVRQINQVGRLLDNAQDCVAQAQRARTTMMELGDGEVVRFLTQNLEQRIRDGKKLCDRMEALKAALQKNLQRYEQVEAELTRKIQGIGDQLESGSTRGRSVTIARDQCLIGENRFGDLIYPDFLSEAAEKFFASNP